MRGFLYWLSSLCLVSSSFSVSQAVFSPSIFSGRYPSLIDATVEELAAGLKNGSFSSVDLVHAYIARIRQVDNLLSVIAELNPEALAIASELDAERQNGTVRGPLHGLPILLKDNVATQDQMNNTAGSWALLGAKVPRDSTIARKLRAAGVIILGKTNMSQWANYRSGNSNSGWSALGGQVLGAYCPFQDPSGSSSGSGVAASIGLALAAIGTETDGSIVSPSSQNNVVGIKPTVGLTSRNLVIPISEHQDTVGPMARTVKDAAYVLQAIAGYDPYDNYTCAIPNNGTIPDYVAACNESALRGARIGIPRNVISLFSRTATNPQIDAFEDAVVVLESAGATVVDNVNFSAAEEFLGSTAETEVLNADFIVNLASYLATLTENPNNITSLADVRRFTRTSPRENYPDRDTSVWDDALDTQGYNNTDPRFWTAYQQDLYFGGEGGLLGSLARHDLDAIILPTNFAFTWAAVVGAPIVTVPLGFYPWNATVVPNRRGNLISLGPHVPFGLSFLGAKWTEATLIGFAYAFEQRTMVRNKVQPYVLPNIDLADIIGT